MLADLNNRNIEDILICLKGLHKAINAIFISTEAQLCVVHQIRNSIRYVAPKNQNKRSAFAVDKMFPRKRVLKDLKQVYGVISKEAVETELDRLEEKWGSKYPIAIQSWRNKRSNLSNYFKYPADIIESAHRQFRKLTKKKGGFPNENSLLKLLYLGIQNAQLKRTMPIQNWSLTLSQLATFSERRIDKALRP